MVCTGGGVVVCTGSAAVVGGASGCVGLSVGAALVVTSTEINR